MRKTIVVGLLLALPALTAAQSGGAEIGVGLVGLASASCSGCGGNYQLQVTPVGLAVAFHSSATVAIEPGLSLIQSHQSSTSFNGVTSDHNSTLAFISLGIQITPGGGYGHAGFYFEPLVGITYANSTNTDSHTQTGFGAGIGTKSRLSDHVSLRWALAVTHFLEETGFRRAYTDVTGNLGISVFLK